jgi:hypothetical protein
VGGGLGKRLLVKGPSPSEQKEEAREDEGDQHSLEVKGMRLDCRTLNMINGMKYEL